jgi:anti-anti-sigma regulatory factor
VTKKTKRKNKASNMNAPVDSDAAAPSGTPESPPLCLDVAAVRIAAKLKSELQTRMAVPGTVRIDASAVERVDTATLQVLAAFFRDMSQASRQAEWCGQSAALERAANTLGLRVALGLAASDK